MRRLSSDRLEEQWNIRFCFSGDRFRSGSRSTAGERSPVRDYAERSMEKSNFGSCWGEKLRWWIESRVDLLREVAFARELISWERVDEPYLPSKR